MGGDCLYGFWLVDISINARVWFDVAFIKSDRFDVDIRIYHSGGGAPINQHRPAFLVNARLLQIPQRFHTKMNWSSQIPNFVVSNVML